MLTDEFMLVEGPIDCDPSAKVDRMFPSKDLKNLYTWLPDTSLSVHICWRKLTSTGYSAWARLENQNGAYSITVTDRTVDRQAFGRIIEFSHPINSMIFSDDQIWFKIEADGREIESIDFSQNLKLNIYGDLIDATFI